MTLIHYDIAIPVADVRPIEHDRVELCVPSFGPDTFLAEADAFYLERKLKAFFMDHYEKEFYRLYKPEEWVIRSRVSQTSILSIEDDTVNPAKSHD